MATADVDKIYQQHIKPLSSKDRRRLLGIMARDLTPPLDERKTHSLMALEGLGAKLWEGLDAQEYVNELRKEWDHRP